MHSSDITAAARQYLGVPFAHQGRTRHGLDCLGLLVMVARDLGLGQAAAQDVCDYAHYPDEARLRGGLERVLQPQDAMAAGCVLLMRVDAHARHLGICAEYSGGQGWSLIHAWAPARKVVEHRLDAGWQQSVAGIYRLK
jgi:cell wall-associated NlpC family hydrolase